MCAYEPIAAGVRESAPSHATEPRQEFSPRFLSAMAEFVRAVNQGRSEPICSGYMGLRSLAGGVPLRQVFQAIDEAVGGKAGKVIVAAFGRRRCFMCGDGTRPCATCHGTGLVERFRCPNCEGLGVEACPFCLGSGWYANEDMPAEIRDPAHQYRLQRISKDLDCLAEIPLAKAIASARKATPEKRRQWATSLMRLYGKLTVLTRHETDGDALIQRCRQGIEHIEQILQALRPPTPPAETKAG